MCGRYRLSRRAEILAGHLYAEYEGMDWEARYNIAPTQTVPVIRQDPREPVRRASVGRVQEYQSARPEHWRVEVEEAARRCAGSEVENDQAPGTRFARPDYRAEDRGYNSAAGGKEHRHSRLVHPQPLLRAARGQHLEEETARTRKSAIETIG